MEHTFVIPAHLAAPGLGILMESLRAQSGNRSEIVLTTSTPSAELEAFARRQGTPLRVNPRRVDIAADWNFALAAAQTGLVTIAHQDDYFASSYVALLSDALRRHPGSILAFCDYSEHTRLGQRAVNINLRIKRMLRHHAFRSRECISETRDKIRLLSLGNPICCPSVMLDRSVLPDFQFPSGFQTNLDWVAWLELARRPGSFVYVRQNLVSKGIHGGSETTATIASRARESEDRAVFDTLWPRPVAAALAFLYRFSYRANRL